MNYIIKFFFAAASVIFCLTACDKYYCYIVEGRVIDKVTKEPVKDIMVSFYKYDIIHPPRIEPKIQKTSPMGYEGWSDANGNFRTLETNSTSLLYIYGYYGGYKDTIISVDFSNATLSESLYKNYKGDYLLNVGDIELEKLN